MQSSAMQSAVDAAGGVSRTLRSAQPKCDESLEQIIRLVESAKRSLELGGGASTESVLSELDRKIQEQIKKALSHTKDIHGAVGKLGKVISHVFSATWTLGVETLIIMLHARQAVEKAVELDLNVCKVLRSNVPTDEQALNQVCGSSFSNPIFGSAWAAWAGRGLSRTFTWRKTPYL